MEFPKTITVAALLTSHIFEIRNYTKDGVQLQGVEGRYLDILMKALGTNYTVILAKDGEAGYLKETGNWTGFMGLLQNGEADIAINSFAITKQREQVVDFTVPYYIEDTTFVVRHKEHSYPILHSYIYPFDVKTWILFIITTFLMPWFFKMFTSIDSSFDTLYFQLFGNVLRQPITLKCFSEKFKILMATWFVFGTILSTSYSAVLLALLTIPLEQKQIKTFEELSKAVEKGTHKVYSPLGRSHVELMLHSENSYFKKLGETISKNGWYFRKWDDEAENLLQPNTAIIGHLSFLRLFFERQGNEDIYISDDKLVSCNIAIAVRKGFCCKSMLSATIQRLMNAGIMEKLINEELFKTRTLSHKASSHHHDHEPHHHEPHSALHMDDIVGSLILLLIGFTVSSMVFIAELFLHRLQKRYQNRKKGVKSDFLLQGKRISSSKNGRSRKNLAPHNIISNL